MIKTFADAEDTLCAASQSYNKIRLNFGVFCRRRIDVTSWWISCGCKIYMLAISVGQDSRLLWSDCREHPRYAINVRVRCVNFTSVLCFFIHIPNETQHFVYPRWLENGMFAEAGDWIVRLLFVECTLCVCCACECRVLSVCVCVICPRTNACDICMGRLCLWWRWLWAIGRRWGQWFRL